MNPDKEARMESRRRTVTKAITYQLMGLVVMTALGTLFTGSAGAGGALAIVSTMIGTVAYVLHERAWGLVRWGLAPAAVMTKPQAVRHGSRMGGAHPPLPRVARDAPDTHCERAEAARPF